MRDMQTAYVNLTDTELADKKREVFANVALAIKGMWNMAQSPTWVRASRRIARIQGLVGEDPEKAQCACEHRRLGRELREVRHDVRYPATRHRQGGTSQGCAATTGRGTQC
jgi:hypothetical protein